MIIGYDFDKLTKNCTYNFKNYKDILNFIICEENSSTALQKCHFNDCDKHPGIDHLETYLMKIFEDNEIEEVNYAQWVSTPRTTLINTVEDINNFITSFCYKIQYLLPHAFISKQQSEYFRRLKNELPENECIVCLDYAENYAFIAQNAPPGFHWNNDQATVFVTYIYYMKQGTLASKGFVIISNKLSHDTTAVFTYQQILISFL